MSFFKPPTDEEVEEQWEEKVGTMRKCLTRQEARRRVFMRKSKQALAQCEKHFDAMARAGQAVDPVVATLFDIINGSLKETDSDGL